MATDYCLATLALGKQYRLHAQLLALDVLEFGLGVPLVVLTDDVRSFDGLEGVKALAHRQDGLMHCFHDKRIVVRRALEHADAVVFMDADCRFLAPPGEALGEQLRPGLQAVNRLPILEKFAQEEEAEAAGRMPKRFNSARRRRGIVERAAARIGVDLQDVQWVEEMVFAVTRDGGREKAFLDTWDALAPYVQLRGYSYGEGESMGMAAERAGWKPAPLDGALAWAFKDYYAMRRIGAGDAVDPRLRRLLWQRKRIAGELAPRGLGRLVFRGRKMASAALRAPGMWLRGPRLRGPDGGPS